MTTRTGSQQVHKRLALLAVIGAAGTGVGAFFLAKGNVEGSREVDVAVATVQAVSALIVMAATVLLARFTAEYVRQTRRLADVAVHQELFRRRAEAADALAGCLEDIRWETTEMPRSDQRLTPKVVRNLCRTWQQVWRRNRALLHDTDLHAQAEEFEQVTREARRSMGEDADLARRFARQMGEESELLIEAVDLFRSTLPPDVGSDY